MEKVLFGLVIAGVLYLLYRASEWASESAFQRQISKKSNALDKEDRAKMRRAWVEYPNTERQSIYLDTPRYPPA